MPRDSELKIHALDMGSQMYGDCLLIQKGRTTILVDGGHQSDFEGQEGYASIPEQLQEILGEPPFELSMLIVTHCHSDHIGCLPELVEDGIIKPTWALIADERLGFGRRTDTDALPLDTLPAVEKAIVAALREEDRSLMDDVELAQFLLDAEKLEDRYKRMLAELQRSGSKVLRYGRDPLDALVAEFSDLGFEVLGPTLEHLAICAESIVRLTTDAADQVKATTARDQDFNPLAIYRSFARATVAADLLDRPGKGAALNNQSIVFKITEGDKAALLAGDMQFAKAEVTGLAPHMRALRQKVAAAGPFTFAKLTHHTSYNGVDDSVLDDFGSPRFLVHTGGLNDPGHPDPGALDVLKARSRDIKLARTDRNGGITYTFARGLEVSKGRLNNFTENERRDTEMVVVPKVQEAQAVQLMAPPQKPGPIDLIFMRIPFADVQITLGNIPISIKVPETFDRGQVEIRVGEESGSKKNTSLSDGALAPGRTLPRLLFVTSSRRLANNIGAEEARRAISLIQNAGMEVLDLPDPSDHSAVRTRIAKADVRGVVLVGGYDVLPSERVDVLDGGLRQRIGADIHQDPDSFIVWSDDKYGDADGDGIAELPVSRIPDAYSSEFLFRNLSGPANAADGRFGIRNEERPFADAIWNGIAGTEAIFSSGVLGNGAFGLNDMQKASIYFMLHGDHADGTRFWGEDEGPVEAINVRRIPPSGIGTVMAGCCWGALTVSQIASRASGPLAVRSRLQSMALTLLWSGARAFVGCTGAHYSPGVGESFFGEPMHRLFWQQMAAANKAPAEALFEARKAYLRGIPHGLSKPFHLGIERKIYKQFTCLGLGW